jgi:hypothetical protein
MGLVGGGIMLAASALVQAGIYPNRTVEAWEAISGEAETRRGGWPMACSQKRIPSAAKPVFAMIRGDHTNNRLNEVAPGYLPISSRRP